MRGLRSKCSTQYFAPFTMCRNILKIWLLTCDTPCCSTDLNIGWMDTIGPGRDASRENIKIGCLQFRQCSILEKRQDNGVLVLEEFQYFSIHRIASLVFLTRLKSEFLKEDNLELLRGRDIKFFSCVEKYGLPQIFYSSMKINRFRIKESSVYKHSSCLHMGKHWHKLMLKIKNFLHCLEFRRSLPITDNTKILSFKGK